MGLLSPLLRSSSESQQLVPTTQRTVQTSFAPTSKFRLAIVAVSVTSACVFTGCSQSSEHTEPHATSGQPVGVAPHLEEAQSVPVPTEASSPQQVEATNRDKSPDEGTSLASIPNEFNFTSKPTEQTDAPTESAPVKKQGGLPALARKQIDAAANGTGDMFDLYNLQFDFNMADISKSDYEYLVTLLEEVEADENSSAGWHCLNHWAHLNVSSRATRPSSSAERYVPASGSQASFHTVTAC